MEPQPSPHAPAPSDARTGQPNGRPAAPPTAPAAPPPTDDPALRGWFAQALRRAKLDAMKELAYGASHEINNPLANIALRAQTLLKREDDADKRKALEAMHRAAMRAHEMISDLMLFARPPALKKSPVDLCRVASGVLEELAETAGRQATGLRLAPGSARAVADPTQLAVALRAVVDNSLQALGQGGAVLVEVGESAGESVAWLRVTDNGPGVPDEIEPHLFDPFFSGREAGRGLGFGLSKCWRIVTDHGGDVRLESDPAKGVVVTMTLPV